MDTQLESVRKEVATIRTVEVNIQASISDQEELFSQESGKAAEWERKVGALNKQLAASLPEGDPLPVFDRDVIGAMAADDLDQLKYRSVKHFLWIL